MPESTTETDLLNKAIQVIDQPKEKEFPSHRFNANQNGPYSKIKLIPKIKEYLTKHCGLSETEITNYLVGRTPLKQAPTKVVFAINFLNYLERSDISINHRDFIALVLIQQAAAVDQKLYDLFLPPVAPKPAAETKWIGTTYDDGQWISKLTQWPLIPRHFLLSDPKANYTSLAPYLGNIPGIYLDDSTPDVVKHGLYNSVKAIVEYFGKRMELPSASTIFEEMHKTIEGLFDRTFDITMFKSQTSVTLYPKTNYGYENQPYDLQQVIKDYLIKTKAITDVTINSYLDDTKTLTKDPIDDVGTVRGINYLLLLQQWIKTAEQTFKGDAKQIKTICETLLTFVLLTDSYSRMGVGNEELRNRIWFAYKAANPHLRILELKDMQQYFYEHHQPAFNGREDKAELRQYIEEMTKSIGKLMVQPSPAAADKLVVDGQFNHLLGILLKQNPVAAVGSQPAIPRHG